MIESILRCRGSSETPDCGGDLLAGQSYEFINSTHLPANGHCVWRIRSILRRRGSSETPDCGGDLLAGQSYEFINSTHLPANGHCVWRIRSAARVLVFIDALQLPCKDACTSYLELKYKSDMVSTGPRLCCGAPKSGFTSTESTFIIIYAGNIFTDDYRWRGFSIRYRLCKNFGALTTKSYTFGVILGYLRKRAVISSRPNEK
ncbi:unnamed protein product [Gongylonema pulchrum]|uniref:CUB domain-containing protein n=1 Tax=Gongylonema pulchrum TaxID=637853 RepID=A0A183DUP9_9BILA|nr:unnamed protein product [Gongylonema pulchrum]